MSHTGFSISSFKVIWTTNVVPASFLYSAGSYPMPLKASWKLSSLLCSPRFTLQSLSEVFDMLSAVGPVVLYISKMTFPHSCLIWAVPACGQHNHILCWSFSLWLEHWSSLLIMLVPSCSFITQSNFATGCLTSNSHQKILFCIADFILSLQKAARILLLCRIYIVVYLQSYFGLVFRLLQDDLLLVTIELFPKTGHNFGLFASIWVAIFHCCLRKLPALWKDFLEFTLLLSLCYSCQLHWQMLYAEIWDGSKKSSLSASLFLGLHSQLSYNWFSNFSPFSLLPQFCKTFLCTPVLCRMQ